MSGSSDDVTRLLMDWKGGNREALNRLTPIVYQELRRLADAYLRDEHAANTLQPTALVHEAYIRLVAQNMPDWECRSHFFGVAAHLMRQILVDHARKHRSAKRGDGVRVITLDQHLAVPVARSNEVIALDDALTSLAKTDERKAKVIELRYFAGLSVEETAQTLGISVATVGREQRLAEAWLHREMTHT